LQQFPLTNVSKISILLYDGLTWNPQMHGRRTRPNFAHQIPKQPKNCSGRHPQCRKKRAVNDGILSPTSETKKDVAEYGIFTATKIAVAAAIGSFAPQIPPDQRRSLKQVHKSFIITINVGRKISATENLHFGTQIKTNTVRKQERINGRMFRKCIPKNKPRPLRKNKN
jgi:hypothetical protein